MGPLELDLLLTDSLLIEASEGLNSVAMRLVGLYDGWVGSGADAASLGWLGQIISDLGWWEGRLMGGVSTIDPSALIEPAEATGNP